MAKNILTAEEAKRNKLIQRAHDQASNDSERFSEERIIQRQSKLMVACGYAVALTANEIHAADVKKKDTQPVLPFANGWLEKVKNGQCLALPAFANGASVESEEIQAPTIAQFEHEVIALRQARDAFRMHLLELGKDNDALIGLAHEFDDARNNAKQPLSDELLRAIVNYNARHRSAADGTLLSQIKTKTDIDPVTGEYLYYIATLDNPYITQINQRIEKLYGKAAPEHTHRRLFIEENGAKTRDGIEKKLARRGLEHHELTDINRIRVVVNSPEEAETFLKQLTAIVGKDNLYTEEWRVNGRGYMDQQLGVIIDGAVCEIQIVPQMMVEVYQPSHRIYEQTREYIKKEEVVVKGQKISLQRADLLTSQEKEGLSEEALNALYLEKAQEALSDYNVLAKYLSDWTSRTKDDRRGKINWDFKKDLTPADFLGNRLMDRYKELDASLRKLHEFARQHMPDGLQDIYNFKTLNPTQSLECQR